jgi:DNA-binding protein HU-alpha
MDNSQTSAEDIDMTVVSTNEPTDALPQMKKKELIEAVAAKVDLKKPDVKAAVEAALEVLGEALTNGQSVNVPPLGKLMIKNSKSGANATVVNLRLRQSKIQDKKPLAEGGEDS